MSENNNEQMIPTPSDFGHFLLEKELGHGGMGGVYLARDKMLDRKVGIKVMLKSLGDDPAFVERFQREAQAAARLNHPNIAQVYSFGTEQGMPYIAMELVSGGSLDKDMAENPGTLDPARVMKIGHQMAEALAMAADQGLVHGDVKPENVLFDTDGNAKLVDFGLAAMQGDSDEIWGTPYYISPEKVRRQKIDFRADIYSLGGTLYHALTGVAPFEGEDATAVVKARFDGPPKPPSEVRPDLPKDIDAIIMRMLEMEPSMRYPTYSSLIGDIKRCLAKMGPVRTSRLANGKLKIKGTKIKMKTTTQTSAPADGGEGAEGEASDAIPQRLRPLVEEAPKKQTNVGAMVGLVVALVVLAVVGTVGGLIWYVKHDKDSKRKAELAQAVSKVAEARSAIANTVKTANEFGANFHDLVAKNDRQIKEAARKMNEQLPADLRPLAVPLLSPGPTKDIADAIAYTNKLLSAQQPAAEAKKPEEKKADAKKPDASKTDAKPAADAKAEPAKTKAKPAATGTESSEEAAAEKAMAEQEARLTGKPVPKDEPKQKEEKAEDKPAAPKEKVKPAEEPAVKTSIPMPGSVKKFGELWADVYLCRAADIRVQGHVLKIQQLAAKADALKGESWETAQALASLSQEVLDAHETMKSLKCVNDAQRKIGIVRSSATSLVSKALLEISAAKAAADAAAQKLQEQKAQADKERELKERMEKAKAEEPAAAQAKFKELAGSRLKTLDWEQALKQLRPLATTFISQEGREEVRSQVKKVECMQGLQKHFIKGLKEHYYLAGDPTHKSKKGERPEFKFSRDGSVVVNVDEKNITIQKYKSVRGHMEPDKGPVKIEWVRLYGAAKPEYTYYMVQLITSLAVKGRETTKIGPLECSNHILGAALTLDVFYGESANAGAVKTFNHSIVKKAAKEFDDCAKWAKKWFPEVEIENE